MSNKNQKKVIHNIRTQVDSFGRKKYRLEQVEQSESQEQQKITNAVIDTGRHKSMLIGRDQGLNIEKYIGKIDNNKKKKATQVFYCDVCEQGFKCDLAFVTHLNSPGHNRKIGMNMKVKSVSLQAVSSKISSLINKKLGKEQQQQEDQLISKIQKNKHSIKPRINNNNKINDGESSNEQDEGQNNSNENGVNSVKQEQTVKKEDEQQQKQQQNQQDQNEVAQLQMMRQMGIPTSFGSKKHKR